MSDKKAEHDYYARLHERFWGFEYEANRYKSYSYKELWKYFKQHAHPAGDKTSEDAFKKLIKCWIDMYFVDRFNGFKKPIEGYFYCEICKLHYPLELFRGHIERDHSMKWEDFIKKYGRVCIPFGGVYAKI